MTYKETVYGLATKGVHCAFLGATRGSLTMLQGAARSQGYADAVDFVQARLNLLDEAVGWFLKVTGLDISVYLEVNEADEGCNLATHRVRLNGHGGATHSIEITPGGFYRGDEEISEGPWDVVSTLMHELVHAWQCHTGRLKHSTYFLRHSLRGVTRSYWNGRAVKRSKISYDDYPWEVQARKLSNPLRIMFALAHVGHEPLRDHPADLLQAFGIEDIGHVAHYMTRSHLLRMLLSRWPYAELRERFKHKTTRRLLCDSRAT